MPIGYITSFDSGKTSYTDVGYGGTFDGQGHVISNLTISASKVSSVGTVGIFGTVTGTVKNLGVDKFFSATPAAATDDSAQSRDCWFKAHMTAIRIRERYKIAML